MLERDEVNLAVAASLAELSARLGIRVVFKGSFDKANRSAADAPRGPGLVRGLAALHRVKQATGLSILTDVHDVSQVDAVASLVDAIQIPAFLCRQTDLLEAAGRTRRPVNIKKGQWMAPEDMRGAVDKVRRGGSDDVAVTERGSFYGYGDLVVDMRGLHRMKAAAGVTVLFDATHAVQRPGRGPDGSSGGVRAEVPALLMAAAAAGADGFYLETHPAPAMASSDAASMWPLHELEALVERTLAVWHAAQEAGAVTWSTQ
jgi:2-dehydro-3-deoxyphosphooctonate aldolase (KDO 8-P synthase)